MSDDDAPTPETPGYRLWAAMNDAETYEPPLSENDFWEYAANTFLDGEADLRAAIDAVLALCRSMERGVGYRVSGDHDTWDQYTEGKSDFAAIVEDTITKALGVTP
jgi:hypothetical protein